MPAKILLLTKQTIWTHVTSRILQGRTTVQIIECYIILLESNWDEYAP